MRVDEEEEAGAGGDPKEAKVVVDFAKGEAGYPARMLSIGVDSIAAKMRQDYTFTRSKVTLPPWVEGFTRAIEDAGDEREAKRAAAVKFIDDLAEKDQDTI